MSIVLGRWPLIPDQRCTVSLPQEVFGTTNFSNVDAPNEFCERRLQIELTRIASDILSSNNGKPSTEPAVIDKSIKRLKVELLDKLPPAFRLYGADEQWDEALPHLRRQREMFRISVFATMCTLLRPTIVTLANPSRPLSASEKKLIAKHRMSLMDTLIEMLDSVGRLHTLMGGKHNRFFLLSFFTLEPAALLGMCLMTPNVSIKEGKQGQSELDSCRSSTAGDQDRWRQGFKRMDEAVARLTLLSEVSSIARTGIKVLKKLVTRINETDMAKSWKGETTNKPPQLVPSFRPPTSPASQASTRSRSSVSSEKPTTASLPPAFGTTPPFSHHSIHSQQHSPLFNTPPEGWGSMYGLDMQIHDGACNNNNNVNWDLNLTDGMMTNSIPLFNDPSVPWPGYQTPFYLSTADTTPVIDTDQYPPGMAMDQDLDWNWMDDYGRTMWFGN